MAGQVVLGYPNLIDSTTLSGGSWLAALPLNNIKNRLINKVARSTNLTLANTQFTITKPDDSRINVIAVVGHNLSLSAKYKITAFSGATLIYTADWQPAYPIIYPSGVLEWEDNNFWTGTPTQDDITGTVRSLIHILPNSLLATSVKIEFDDTTNPATYIDVGRVFIGKSWSPVLGIALGGATLKWETKTDTQESLGGSEYFQRRTPYRVANFTLPLLTEAEGLTNAYEIMRGAGIDKEVLYIHSSSDTEQAFRRRFLGRLRQLSPIEYPVYSRTSTAFEIKEII